MFLWVILMRISSTLPRCTSVLLVRICLLECFIYLTFHKILKHRVIKVIPVVKMTEYYKFCHWSWQLAATKPNIAFPARSYQFLDIVFNSACIDLIVIVGCSSNKAYFTVLLKHSLMGDNWADKIRMREFEASEMAFYFMIARNKTALDTKILSLKFTYLLRVTLT